MEELIKKIEDACNSYNSVSKSRPDDEWLKGFVGGLLQAKQYVYEVMRKK